jgi:hypothetical protein
MATVKELEDLIAVIGRNALLSKEEMSTRAGYNPGYITQTISRGKVPDKLIRVLKREFAKYLPKEPMKLAPAGRVPDADSFMSTYLLKNSAMLEVILEVMAEQNAKQTNQPVTTVLAQFEKAVSTKLEDKLGKLQ